MRMKKVTMMSRRAEWINIAKKHIAMGRIKDAAVAIRQAIYDGDQKIQLSKGEIQQINDAVDMYAHFEDNI